jgi:hypothetical protein
MAANSRTTARAEYAVAAQETQNGHFRPSSATSTTFPPFLDQTASWAGPQPLHPIPIPTDNDATASRISHSRAEPTILPFNGVANTTFNRGLDITNPSAEHHMVQPEDCLFTDIPGLMSLTDISSSNVPFSRQSTTNNQGHPSPEQRREQQPYPTGVKIPSRKDVREWNASQQNHQRQQSFSSCPDTLSKVDSVNLKQHLLTFNTAVTSVGADISGVALTLADYISWVRRSPEQCNEGMLEIFEARAREIAEAATSGMAAVVEQSMTPSLRNASKDYEATARVEHEKAEFFQSSYDIQRSLAQQRRR